MAGALCPLRLRPTFTFLLVVDPKSMKSIHAKETDLTGAWYVILFPHVDWLVVNIFNIWPIHHCYSLTYQINCQVHLEFAAVGRTLSLHYYYLAFIVLTYLAYLIAVNTSYVIGYYRPGHTSPYCIRLVIRRKWETLTFSFYSSVGSVLIWSSQDQSHVTSWQAQSAPDHFQDSFQSRFIEKLEDLTGTSNTLMWSRCFHNLDHH
jgi:hypothetical protein